MAVAGEGALLRVLRLSTSAVKFTCLPCCCDMHSVVALLTLPPPPTPCPAGCGGQERSGGQRGAGGRHSPGAPHAAAACTQQLECHMIAAPVSVALWVHACLRARRPRMRRPCTRHLVPLPRRRAPTRR